jgi:hypothetical protein
VCGAGTKQGLVGTKYSQANSIASDGGDYGKDYGKSRRIQSRRQGVGKELGVDFRVLESIGDFCQEERSLLEIAEHLGLGDRYKMKKKKYIDPILGKYIEMTIPDAPNSKLQKYILTDAGRAWQNQTLIEHRNSDKAGGYYVK